jgi:hypothetical protein
LTSKQYGTDHGFIFERLVLEEEKKLEGKEGVRITLDIYEECIYSNNSLLIM